MTFTLNTKAGRKAGRLSLYLKRAVMIAEGRIKPTAQDEAFALEHPDEIAKYRESITKRAANPRA